MPGNTMFMLKPANSLGQTSIGLFISRLLRVLIISFSLTFVSSWQLQAHSKRPVSRPDRMRMFLYVMSDEFMTYRIRQDGHLSRAAVDPPYLGRYPYFVNPAPGGHSVFIGGIDDEYNTPSGYIERFVVSQNGKLVSPHGGSAGAEPTGLAVGQAGRFVYILADRALRAYRVQPSGNYKPLTSPSISVGADAFVSGAPNGRTIILSRPSERRIVAYRASSDGALKQVSNLGVGSKLGQSVWRSSGATAYVPSLDGGTINTLSVTANSRASVVQSLKVAPGPQYVFLAVHPTRRFLYASCAAKGAVKIIPIQATGKLDGSKVRTFAVRGVTAIAITPDGRFAYMMSTGTQVITQCKINPDGSLSALFPPFVSGGKEPVSMAIGRS